MTGCTHLLRGATFCQHCTQDLFKFQLTHLLRGATFTVLAGLVISPISTHAPLARCDWNSVREHGQKGISTHAPLARCDSMPPENSGKYEHFNSRTSCEVRQIFGCEHVSRRQFQLTHLLRGATYLFCNLKGGLFQFQLTHLLRGATLSLPSRQRGRKFQLTHLLRGATRARAFMACSGTFQLTHLLRGATCWPPGRGTA